MAHVTETEWRKLASPRPAPADEPTVAVLPRGDPDTVQGRSSALAAGPGQVDNAVPSTTATVSSRWHPSASVGLAGDRVVAADPQRLEEALPGVSIPPREAQRLRGRWLYVGNWMRHFGHFLTETLTTLWPAEVEVAGLVGHPFVFGSASTEWQERLLALAGYGGLPRAVAADTTVVDELILPERTYLPNGYARPQAVETWQRVAQRAGDATQAGGAVFLSRSSWNRRPAALPAGRRPEAWTTRPSSTR